MDSLAHKRATDGRAHWRFVALTGAVVALLLGATAAFNAWMDTTGMLGTGLVDPIAALPRDRVAKVELLRRADDPDVVVLGSSRAKRIDPALTAPGAGRGVNAATVGADLLESRVIARWLAERATEDRPFPHLVIGVDVEQFRGSSLRESSLLSVPAVADVARREVRSAEESPSVVPLLDDLLLTWSATRTSVDAAFDRQEREDEARRAAARQASVTRTQPIERFRANGLLASDERFARAGFRASVANDLPREIKATIHDYAGRYARYGDQPSAAAIDDFHELVRTANAEGDTPLVILTPMHPAMQRAMRVNGRELRRERVLATLRAEAATGRIQLVDCSRDCIDGNPLLWSDGVHVTPLGARVLAREARTRAAAAEQTR